MRTRPLRPSTTRTTSRRSVDHGMKSVSRTAWIGLEVCLQYQRPITVAAVNAMHTVER